MPHGQTKFQSPWLEKIDINGHQVKLWCRKDNSEYAGYCFICDKSIQCGNNGVTQILNHADGVKHKEKAKLRFDKNQKRFVKEEVDKPSALQGGGDVKHVALQSRSQADQVTAAEVIWAMKVASSGYSFSSCDGTAAMFQEMFPGQISNDFTMSRTKVSYMLSDGLGPYFRGELAKQISENKVYFTLQFDETGNAQGNKQCDVLVRFWNSDTGQVSTQFLKYLMFGHAKGKDLAQALLDTISEKGYEIPLNQLLSLGSDGPNVNKTVHKYINDHMKEIGLHELVKFLPCPLHIVHNGFRKGLTVFGERAEELALDLFQWFRTHTCQKEDFANTLEKLNLEADVFLRHVQCRWLTLLPCLERIKHNWTATYHYFLKDLPQISVRERSDKFLKKNERYKRICEKLKTKEVLIEVEFLLSVGVLFTDFLSLFQKQEPLIHLLYPESTDLLKKVAGRFMKSEVISGKKGSQLIKIDTSNSDNVKDTKDMDIGTETREMMGKLEGGQQKSLLRDMQSFYQEVFKYLSKRLPLDEPIVRNAQCLNPEVQEQEAAQRMLPKLAACLPNISKEETTRACDEWKIYREEEVEDKFIYDENDNMKRIDGFWNEILGRKTAAGMLKFSTLRKIVTSTLSLFHGNADVERSLSINKKLLTAERTLLSEEALNGLRITRDAVSQYEGDILKVPINKKMTATVRESYKNYKRRCDDEKSEMELLKKRKTEQGKEKEEMLEKMKKNEERKRKLVQMEKMSELMKNNFAMISTRPMSCLKKQTQGLQLE